jgi:glycine/D-amino acid oxidase-like deaminating enzyme
MMWGTKKSPAQIVEAFGAERGARMNNAVAQAGRTVRELIARHDIQCDARLEGNLCLARTPQSLEKTIAGYDAWAAYGGRFDILSRDALARYIASDAYAGGVLLADAGALNPLRFTHGLARAAQSAGVTIYANSPATRAVHKPSGWTITTAQGSVRAGTLLIAGGAYLGGLFPALRKEAYEVCSAIVATDPLPDQGRSILPGGAPMADLDDAAIFAPVIDAQGRLIVSMLFQGGAMTMADAERIVRPRLARAFPQADGAPFTQMWGGKFLMTADGAPHLVRLGHNAYAALGCNGMGHTLGILAAQDLGRLGAGAAEADVLFPITAPKSAPMHGVMTAALRHVMAPMMNRQLA